MIVLARALVRLVAFVLLVVLALLGLAVAAAALDPSGVTGALGLPDLRDSVGGWFTDLEADGPTALASALAGGGAILLGLLLLVGVLVPRRERLVRLERTEHGTLSARRRALGALATQLTEQARGVTGARARVRPRRRGGGRLRVRADRPGTTSPQEAESAIAAQLETLTGPFALKAAVQTRRGERGARVQ